MRTGTKSILSAFESFIGDPHRGSEHVNRIYEEARSAMDALDIPSRRTEAWKYTPITMISNAEWRQASPNAQIDLDSLPLPELDCIRFVIVDGFFRPELSDALSSKGIELMTMGKAMQAQDGFEKIYGRQADHKNELLVSVNTAFASGGVYLKVLSNSSMPKPVHVIHVNTQKDTAVLTRNVIEVCSGAKGRMIQSFYHTDGPLHSNVVSEVSMEDNSTFVLDKFQSGNEETYHYSTEEVIQGKHSTFSSNTVTIDGGWTRNEPHVRFQGMNSTCHLNGAYLPSKKELIDNHSIIDHLVPRCESHELYKGVVYDSAKGVFNGKVFVRPDAQRTNAYQQNANIVMSDKASMNSKPELEIYADDVKCSHGSTTGQIDKEALFYLQCRGLSKNRAMRLLINAFVGEVIEQMDADIQDYAWERLATKLNAH